MCRKSNQSLLILFLRKVLRKIQDRKNNKLLAQIGIGVIRFEICQNFGKRVEFSKVCTIRINSQEKRIFLIDLESFEKQLACIEKTDNIYTQIEQIFDDVLLISGEREKDERFTIQSQILQTTLNYKMKHGRFCHRTSFNKRDAIYIISGNKIQNQLQQDVEECEIFSLREKSFCSIKQIPFPVQQFGCDQKYNQIQIFGGFSENLFQGSDKIQIYDKERDEWNLGQQTLSKTGRASALYIPYSDSFLVYRNGFSNIETQIIDSKNK